jgi:hypothetical protein
LLSTLCSHAYLLFKLYIISTAQYPVAFFGSYPLSEQAQSSSLLHRKDRSTREGETHCRQGILIGMPLIATKPGCRPTHQNTPVSVLPTYGGWAARVGETTSTIGNTRTRHWDESFHLFERATNLRRAYFVEYYEDYRLNKPCKRQVLFPSPEHEPRPQRQRHLWYEANQGRTRQLAEQGIRQELVGGRV